ncbi:hypothetical protein KQI52_06615 [bacterium]|nr:hypothetical protein [bacterium]
MSSTTSGEDKEKLVAEMAERQYLKGFVFHSPMVDDPTEVELGDVLIWIRYWFIVIEVAWRNTIKATSIRRQQEIVREKRKQLLADFERYNKLKDTIRLQDAYGNDFGINQFDPRGFVGVVMVDSNETVDHYHPDSVTRFQDLPFPVTVFLRSGFLRVIDELDTVPDLGIYIHDRFDFMKRSGPHAEKLLHLHPDLEPSLLAFYKLHDNSFNEGYFEKSRKHWIAEYDAFRKEHAQKRDEENRDSKLIDSLILHINSFHPSAREHAWQLANLTRRERAGWVFKIMHGFYRIKDPDQRRHFTYESPSTNNHCLFVYSSNHDRESFIQHCEHLGRLKIVHEIDRSRFKHSVFVFGFRKSSVRNEQLFDDLVLTVFDADQAGKVTSDEVAESRKFFGGHQEKSIEEFPE